MGVLIYFELVVVVKVLQVLDALQLQKHAVRISGLDSAEEVCDSVDQSLLYLRVALHGLEIRQLLKQLYRPSFDDDERLVSLQIVVDDVEQVTGVNALLVSQSHQEHLVNCISLQL